MARNNNPLTWRSLILTAVLSVIIAVSLTLIIVRWCFSSGPGLPLSIYSLVCSRQAASRTAGSFRRLTPQEILVTSNITESKEFSLDKGLEAAKLTDGSHETLAAPASQKIDYLINFNDDYEINRIKIYWGDYGYNENYINQWRLEASNDGKTWQEIESGERPRAAETIIKKRFKANNLRLQAQSPQDWIGIYEVEIIGRTL